MKENRKQNIIGGLLLVTGVIVGAATTLLINQTRPMNASRVLKLVKEEVGLHRKIVGSWIDYDPVEFPAYDAKPLVYIGGLTVEENDTTRVFQFAADIYNGNLLDLFELNHA